MMLAACLDAAEDSENLRSRVVEAIKRGMPTIASEFELGYKRVWRGMGSISGLHVTVDSIYDHEPAPVPARVLSGENKQDDAHHNHFHHAHSHTTESYGTDEGESPGAIERKPLETTDQQGHVYPNRANEHSQGHHHDEHSHDHHHDHSHLNGHQQAACEHHKSTHSNDHLGSNVPIRNLPEIRQMLQNAPVEYIPIWVQQYAIEAFTELARAEAAVHGIESEEAVHFHEVGAIDSIVDIVGTVLALYFLGVDTVSCSPLPMGEGSVWTAHGILPVPAPATLLLMVGMRTTPGPPGITGELVTPTAAALLKVLTKRSRDGQSGRPPHFTIRSVGVGAGTKDFQMHPNIARLMLGDNVIDTNRTSSLEAVVMS
jgi:pyridinium-3,5-bisthiocarboxylic acid mononucleotide nickel chelatase